MMSDAPHRCPICRHETSEIKTRDYGERVEVDCYKCGPYEVTRTALEMLPLEDQTKYQSAAALSYAIREIGKSVNRPQVDGKNIKSLASTKLPRPHELADNFILWIGSYLRDRPGKVKVKVGVEEVTSIIGATDGRETVYIADELERAGLIWGKTSMGEITLTLDGWQRFDEITRATVDSRQAFMAMPFGDGTLDNIFENYWKPAVKATGFDLHRLTDKQRAGLIDDRLRVEIRRSRFLISEITGQNRGAYWEAGFAEGLNRPVIYTCRKSEFEDTHFDTNHCLTILWEEDTLVDAVEELKACIRETLPAEAIMADPELDA